MDVGSVVHFFNINERVIEVMFMIIMDLGMKIKFIGIEFLFCIGFFKEKIGDLKGLIFYKNVYIF